MSRGDTPSDGPTMMAFLHRKMMQLHTHSLTYLPLWFPVMHSEIFMMMMLANSIFV